MYGNKRVREKKLKSMAAVYSVVCFNELLCQVLSGESCKITHLRIDFFGYQFLYKLLSHLAISLKDTQTNDTI